MKYVLCIDYDGTLFEESWPKIGDPRKDVIKQVKSFKKAGANIVLWTCREGKSLQEALSRTSKEGLSFDAVNEAPQSQKDYQLSKLEENGDVFGLRKIFANLYVDDRSPGSIEHFLSLDPKEAIDAVKDEK